MSNSLPNRYFPKIDVGCPWNSRKFLFLRVSILLLFAILFQGLKFSNKLLHLFKSCFSYLCPCHTVEMKTREQHKNNKRTEIKRFDWFIERKQTHLAFGWLSKRSAEKNFMPEELSRSCFDVILQHDWSMEQCLLHIRVFFGGKTKSPCFVLFIHWLIKQITNTYWNHFSRSYENRSISE